MIPEADLVICVVVAAVTGNKFCLAVAFEAGARYDVEHTVSAVAIFRRISAALHFQVVDVFRIELRSDIRRDVRIRNRDPVEKP